MRPLGHLLPHFNPRSPHGERRCESPPILWRSGISTHAPRTGSDARRYSGGITLSHFNPRSPHGERPGRRERPKTATKFQPTLPARGATMKKLLDTDYSKISTHAPRTGSDLLHAAACMSPKSFQPTLPARGATRDNDAYLSRLLFQPTLPARGATITAAGASAMGNHFNPRSPHGERLGWHRHNAQDADFNPRSPHGERR